MAHANTGENPASFWASWAGSDRTTGQITSPIFRAPQIIEFYVSGYPSRKGNGIFLARPDTGERYELKLGGDPDPGQRWRMVQWWVPANLRGKSVSLTAVDGNSSNTGWLGISDPRGRSLVGLVREQLPELVSLPLAVLDLAIFLLPGFAIAALVSSRRRTDPLYLLILILVSSGTFGYLSFWLFFWHKPLGGLFTWISVVSSLLVLGGTLIRNRHCRATLRETSRPFPYVIAAGVLYVSVFYLFSDPRVVNLDLSGTRFFQEVRPGDQMIAFIFANKLYRHLPLEPFCCGGWLSSDRPPLQAGMFLFTWPLRVYGSPELNYQLFTTLLQCLWICGVWAVLVALNTPRKHIRCVLTFLIFSGFLLFNSTYPWPKLLAASYVLLIVSVLLKKLRETTPFTAFEISLVALALGLTLLSHPGSVFSLPAFAGIVLLRPKLLSFRLCAVAAFILACFVLSWSAYQKYVDPPGNRLLKWHLAGVMSVDSRSTWQALKDQYGNFSLRMIASYKLANVRYLLGPQPLDWYGLNAIGSAGHIRRDVTEATRTLQREIVWNALGVLNLGWPAAFVALRKRMVKLRFLVGWLLLAPLLNLLVWCLLLYLPNSTFTTHASYADLLLLALGLCLCLVELPAPVVLVILGLQIYNFIAVWALSGPSGPGLAGPTAAFPAIHIPFLATAVITAIWILSRLVPHHYLASETTSSNALCVPFHESVES